MRSAPLTRALAARSLTSVPPRCVAAVPAAVLLSHTLLMQCTLPSHAPPLARQALSATWCCSKSGAIPFDVPLPLADSQLSAADGACQPHARSSYPGVAAALAAQDACLADRACFTNCKNRLSKNGRVACRDLNISTL
jgi:hypothetical protein